MQLVKETARQLNVSRDSVQISLLQFGDSAHVEFDLNVGTARSDVLKLVDAVTYEKVSSFKSKDKFKKGYFRYLVFFLNYFVICII